MLGVAPRKQERLLLRGTQRSPDGGSCQVRRSLVHTCLECISLLAILICYAVRELLQMRRDLVLLDGGR